MPTAPGLLRDAYRRLSVTTRCHARWLGACPVFGLEFALLLAILFGVVGRDYGLRDLFLHDDWRVALASGVSVAVLVHIIYFMSVALETRGRASFLGERWVAEGADGSWFVRAGEGGERHLPADRLPELRRRLLRPAMLVLCLPWLFDLVRAVRGDGDVRRVAFHDVAFPAGVCLVFLASRLLNHALGRLGVELRFRTAYVLGIYACCMVLLMGMDLLLPETSTLIPASVSICWLLALVAMLAYATFGLGVVKLVAAVLVVGLVGYTNSDPYKLRLPGLGLYYRDGSHLKVSEPQPATSVDDPKFAAERGRVIAELKAALGDPAPEAAGADFVPDPTDAEAWRRLARSVADGSSDAVADLSKALTLTESRPGETELPEILVERAVQQSRRGEPDAAEASLRRALKIDPGHVGARAELVKLEVKDRKNFFAQELYRLLGEDHESGVDALESLFAQSVEEVIPRETVEELVRADARPADLHLIRGFVAYANFQYPEAVTDLAKAVESSPSAFAYMTLSYCHAILGRTEAQLAALNSAYRLKPTLLVLEQRAGLLMTMGRNDEAIEDCIEWGRISGAFSGRRGVWTHPLKLIPKCHIRARRWGEAISWCDRFLRATKNPMDKFDLYLLRASACKELGDKVEEDRSNREAKKLESEPAMIGDGRARPPLPFASAGHLATSELTDDEALRRWGQARRAAGKPKPKLLVVATSGGGVAAAHWTTLCLTEIEREVVDFPFHLRIVTGASGGMVGAANYVASIEGPGMKTSPERIEDLRRAFRKDYLTPAVRRLVFRDFPSIICPIPQSNDRGRVLERSLAEHTGGRLGLKLVDLRAGEAHGWRPSLVVSPTIVEQGRPLIVSNLAFDPNLKLAELRSWFPAATKFTLATALRLNAAFPYVTPAVTLPTDPPLRIVDAGYLDNSGVGLAADWIIAHGEWLRENTSGVGLIEIQTYPVVEQKKREESLLGKIGTALQPFTSPVEGFAGAKAELLESRNEEKLRQVRESFALIDGPEFETFMLSCPGEFQAPLNWRLSDFALNRMKEGLTTARSEVSKLKNWMETP